MVLERIIVCNNKGVSYHDHATNLIVLAGAFIDYTRFDSTGRHDYNFIVSNVWLTQNRSIANILICGIRNSTIECFRNSAAGFNQYCMAKLNYTC